MTPEERADLFGDFNPDAYAAEAEQRWGGTPAWEQSQRRMASYGKQDWQQFMSSFGDLSARIATLMHAGVPATSAEAMDLAEEHRLLLTRWCYDCTYEIHLGLGELYVSDPRFTASIDATAPGLALYLRDAITANATRATTS
ncbi:TipAS antibiotic-recognition domain-containing protein [Nonomuraea sp. NPDC050310]|uniref:TipAS antibiotic-recognition domain-containing protein n=1 Tax=Nonomuraea sp. NPDC050310 TaxID=3154935 RepID=UPI0033DE5564